MLAIVDGWGAGELRFGEGYSGLLIVALRAVDGYCCWGRLLTAVEGCFVFPSSFCSSFCIQNEYEFALLLLYTERSTGCLCQLHRGIAATEVQGVYLWKRQPGYEGHWSRPMDPCPFFGVIYPPPRCPTRSIVRLPNGSTAMHPFPLHAFCRPGHCAANMNYGAQGAEKVWQDSKTLEKQMVIFHIF